MDPDHDKTSMRSGTRILRQATTGAGEYSANILPIGTRLGNYEIMGLIGEGGFGIVYLAYDHVLERNVAVKEYMPSTLASRTANLQIAVKSERYASTFALGLHSFVNEAKLLARFDHPALVKVYQFWEANGTAYMVMPFYEGPTLKQALREGTVIPAEAWFRRFLPELFDAVEAIHARHCLHRDIAPDNILVLKNGRPLLLDFGAARHVIGDLTQDFTAILKPGFAPIEQYANIQGMKQGPWTDVYALAAVVYHAIGGRAPPPAVERMLADEMVPASEIGRGRYDDVFLAALDRALKVRPVERTQSVDEFRRMLGLQPPAPDDAHASDTIPCPVPSPALSGASVGAVSSTAPFGRSRRLAWIAAGIFMLAGATALVNWWLMPRMPAPQQTTAVRPIAPSVTAQPFDIRNVLDEVRVFAEPDRKVLVGAERQPIRIGTDRLQFSITSARDGYAYVLMLGSDLEALHMLFPNSQDADNQIKANVPMHLPRPGWAIAAGGPAGDDRLLVIVSDVPRDFSAAGWEQGTQSAKMTVDAARRAAAAATVPPGILFGGTPVCPAAQPSCSPAYAATLFTVSEVKP